MCNALRLWTFNGCQTVYTQGILTNELCSFQSDVIVNQTITSLKLTIFKNMNHKVPISSSVFERFELSVQKIVSRSNGLSYLFKSAFQTAQAICQKKPKKQLSAFGTVRADLFKKICQPFQLSVGKNKTVSSSFHWKVKCCE